MSEQQNIEYKQSWNDEYLKWVCGFANAQGGKLFIGIADNGDVFGLSDQKKLMEDIPNKIVSHLGLVVDVNLHEKDGKHYIEIDVPQSVAPISFKGAFHYRSGSTKQELKGAALQNWLLRKTGKHWENIPVAGKTIDDIDLYALKAFVSNAVHKERIPTEALKYSELELLDSLNLITEGQLTNAGLLLFGKKPLAVSPTASIKIGRFGKDDHDLISQDIIETNLFSMADKVIEILKVKYLSKKISYSEFERVETLDYPDAALREAILNALIHKDYTSTFTFIRVHDDRLEIWNPGLLPDELSIEKLKQRHSSYPRNVNIAGVFFKSGYVESWGRGTTKMISACLEAGLPEPEIEEDQGGVRITFKKDIFNHDSLVLTGISDRQVKALLFTKDNGKITNSDYQQLNDIGKSVAATDLQELTDKKLLRKEGGIGRGAHYVLNK